MTMIRATFASLLLVTGLAAVVFAGTSPAAEIGVALNSEEMNFTVGATPPCSMSAYTSGPICKSGLKVGSCVQAFWCCDSTSTTAAFPCAQESTWVPAPYLPPANLYLITVDCADQNGTSCTCSLLGGCFTNNVVIGKCGTKSAGGPC